MFGRKSKPPTSNRRITQISQSQAKKTKKRRIFYGTILIVLIIFLVSKDKGTYQLLKFKYQQSVLQNEIEVLVKKKKELEELKKRIENDPDYIEKVAREKYKMKKKGERVYQVVEK